MHFFLFLLTIYSCDTLPVPQLTEKQFRSGARSLDGTNNVFMISGYSQVRKQGGRSLKNPINYPTLKVKSPNQLIVGAVSKVKNRLADPVFEKKVIENQIRINQDSNRIASAMEENIFVQKQANTTIAISNEVIMEKEKFVAGTNNSDSKSISLMSKDKVEQKVLNQNKNILSDDIEDLIFENSEAIKNESMNTRENSSFKEFVEQKLEMSTIMNFDNPTKKVLTEFEIENDKSTEDSIKSTITTTSFFNEDIAVSTIQPDVVSQMNESGIYLTEDNLEELDILRKSVNDDKLEEEIDSGLIDFGDIQEI